MSEPLLSVRDLTICVRAGRREFPVVGSVSFDVAEQETVGVVGESGSGKSMTMLAVMGLLPEGAARVVSGSISFEGMDLTSASDRQRRAIRGNRMAMVYQDPMTSLNPFMRIGDQVAEVLTAHGYERSRARLRAIEALGEVGIGRPERAFKRYPHEFSGGMQQRVVIAMALALKPKLLIADEPTTALDVTIQQQIIDLVKDLQSVHHMAVVWITHDLGVVARVAKRLMVMYAGSIVESSTTSAVLREPEHPYSAGLIGAIPPLRNDERPALRPIPGAPPDLAEIPDGCSFHPRCSQMVDRCQRETPRMMSRGEGVAACWVPRQEWTT